VKAKIILTDTEIAGISAMMQNMQKASPEAKADALLNLAERLAGDKRARLGRKDISRGRIMKIILTSNNFLAAIDREVRLLIAKPKKIARIKPSISVIKGRDKIKFGREYGSGLKKRRSIRRNIR